jgi:hypothetical protein
MRGKCKCKLPWVQNGTDTCTQCGNQQSRFLPIINDKPISLKREFNGTEFKANDVVEVIGKSYACLVEIVNYIPNGWYQVRLPNGGLKETQILGDVVSL